MDRPQAAQAPRQGLQEPADVDVRFGPLTCFVGHNGGGKSNLFDAIHFLRLLADDEIPNAAAAVRSEGIEVMLHQDGGSRGRPIPAGRSPRTVLGGTNGAEYPTVLSARREMASWNTLHLEPSAMRAPDPFGGAGVVDERGGHLAAALSRLAARPEVSGDVYTAAANLLADLVPEIQSLRVDRDEARQQLVLLARRKGCAQELGPRSLSDGTLRFLALVTMQLDPGYRSVLCLEEPENGMHPARVPAMVKLLRDFSVDPQLAVDDGNPLRQAILNTHSPDVARQLDMDQVLFVDSVDTADGRAARVRPVSGTWRGDADALPNRRFADFLGGSPVARG